MSEPENLVLQILRRVEDRPTGIEERIDPLWSDVRDMSVRLAHVEESQAGLQRRQDRFDARLDRIEKRFDLVDFPPGVRE